MPLKQALALVGFIIILSGCSANYDHAFDALVNQDNFHQQVVVDTLSPTGLSQTLEVDGELYRYQTNDAIYYVDASRTPVTFIDVHNEQTIELAVNPIEHYIHLEALSLSLFTTHNDMYRLKEEYMVPSVIEGLGELEDVFMTFDQETVTFTVFTNLPGRISETTIEIVYSAIGTTRITLP